LIAIMAKLRLAWSAQLNDNRGSGNSAIWCFLLPVLLLLQPSNQKTF